MSESAIYRVPIELWQHILHLLFFLDLDEAEIPSWRTWRRRKAQYDITASYHVLCGERARLRLVNRLWNELVDQLPSTWVRLRTSEGPILSFKSISLFNSIPLPARVMPLLRRHTIQTLSLVCEAGSATHILPEVTRNAHTLTHLQALHVCLRGCSANNAGRLVIRLVAAFAQNLVTLRLSVPTLTYKSPPDLHLPKLRRLRVDCEAASCVNQGIPRWSLPSIQWLEVPSLAPHFLELQWAPQIHTLVLRTASSLHANGLWSHFPALRTIKVRSESMLAGSLPGPGGPIRELVVGGQLGSLNASLPALQAFVEASRTRTELPQTDGNSGCVQHRRVDGRKVILEGVDWAAPGFLREEIMISSAQWDKIAPFLEDECGVSWLKAKTCFAHFKRTEEENSVEAGEASAS